MASDVVFKTSLEYIDAETNCSKDCNYSPKLARFNFNPEEPEGTQFSSFSGNQMAHRVRSYGTTDMNLFPSVPIDETNFNADDQNNIQSHGTRIPDVAIQNSRKNIRNVICVVRVLQLLGFFPVAFSANWTTSLIFVTINAALFGYNMVVTNFFISENGLMHGMTITTIITGFLPLQNVFNLLIFTLMVQRNVHILKSLQYLDSDLTWTYNPVIVASSSLIFLIPCVARICQYLYGPATELDTITSIGFILVPLLRVWQLVPLVYYSILCHIITLQFRRLRKILMRDGNFGQRSLHQYYDKFSTLCCLCKKVAIFFGPFVLVSITFTVVNLGLSIYFVTQLNRSLVFGTLLPPQLNNSTSSEAVEFYERLVVNRLFDLGWGAMQVIIAVIYMVVVCNSGRTVNEQVSRFHIKLNTQLSWGISVWRAFLVERSLLFTLISTIMAYALILVRLRTGGKVPPPD